MSDIGGLGIRTMRAFSEVMRTGSATAAGRELGLTQSAISRMIAQLETAVGFELFWRDKGRLIPTKDATFLLEEVDLALAGIARVDSLARDIAGFGTGELKIVAPPSFTQTVVPEIAARFRSRFPEVRLSLDSRSVETARSMIATRVVDCGFIKLPIDRSDIHVETVSVSDTVCVLPQSHPLTNLELLTAADLADNPLVLLGARRDVQSAIDRAFRAIGRRPNLAVETTTVGSACALVTRGLGIALVNGMLAEGFLTENLVARPFRPAIAQEYAFAVSSQSSSTRLATAFLECVREHFARTVRADA